MGDGKRWSVTYTKHLKQKRKVYQDGFLELQSSGSKVMLYDEYEKLLESRFVKKDDVIESGGTLAFASYIVDIGDLCGDQKPIPSLSFQGKDPKVMDNSGSLHNNKSGYNSSSVDRKPNFGEKKARVINLSPSQKIIREYKKGERNKYCVLPSSSNTMNSTTKVFNSEWQVLYTTQIHQKAKKFHDGFLQLVVHGSQARQVMLYDTTRRLLDSRFLKRDETITSGESLVFDSHLVDIGECEGDYKPPKDLNVQTMNHEAIGKAERTYNQAKIQTNSKFPSEYKRSEGNKYFTSPSCSVASKLETIEWQVLYTTQITQKAKKFHNGFLQLIVCGSKGGQVMLYDTTRKLLDSRFLKRDEVVSSGESLTFGGHLVDIGEREKDNNPPEDLALQGINCGAAVTNPTNRKFHTGRPQKKISQGTCIRESNNKSSKIEDAKLSWTIPANKPRRAAHEILSNLRKSMSQEFVSAKQALMEESNDQQSSDVHSRIKNQIKEHPQGCNGNVLKESKENIISAPECGTDLESEAVNEVLPMDARKVGDHDEREKSQAGSSRSGLRSAATNCSTLTLDPPGVGSQEMCGLSSSQLPKLLEVNKGSAASCQNGAAYVGAVVSDGCVVQHPSDVMQLRKDIDPIEMDDFPSFDLGI